MKDRDPMPLLMVLALVIPFVLQDDAWVAFPVLLIWATGLFFNLECGEEAQKRGELLEWSLRQPM